jgi:serine protease Do
MRTRTSFSDRASAQILAAALAALLLPAAALAQASSPAWMGVGVAEVTADKVSELKLKEERGAVIVTVAPESPAAQAGLKENDVVLEYAGQRVISVEQFQRMVRETPAGRTIALQISRDGAPQQVSVTLKARPGVRRVRVAPLPPRPPRPPMVELPEIDIDVDIPQFDREITIFTRTARLGIDGESLTKQLGEYFGAPDGQGVLVRSVDAGSSAEQAGLKAGDVITKVDGERVATIRDLRNLLRDRGNKSPLAVTVIRNKREMTVNVTVDRREQGPGVVIVQGARV